jgi:hypothetical protein
MKNEKGKNEEAAIARLLHFYLLPFAFYLREVTRPLPQAVLT